MIKVILHFFSFGGSSNTWSYVIMHVMQLLTDDNEHINDQLLLQNQMKYLSF